MTNRRQFLARAGQASLFVGLSGLPLQAAIRTMDQHAIPGRLLGKHDDLEGLIRRFIEVPADRALDDLHTLQEDGTPDDACYAALFCAAARATDFHHAVFVIHSAHEIGRAIGERDASLPLYWSLAYLKRWQSRNPGVALRHQPVPAGRFPTPSTAVSALRSAMDGMRREEAERALLAVADSRGPRAAMDELWRYGARDWTFVGHRAIAVASARRSLDTLGWRYAGSALRFLNGFLYDRGATGGVGQSHAANSARVEQARNTTLPHDWSVAPGQDAATRELVASIRTADVDSACGEAYRMLLHGDRSATTVWDAVLLAAAELMIRARDGDAGGGYPLHAVTSANALQTAFRGARDDSTRLYLILQAVGWVTEFTRASIELGGLRDRTIDDLQTVPIAGTARDAAGQILASLRPSAKPTSTPAKPTSTSPADPTAHDRAANRTFAYGRRFEDPTPFVRASLHAAMRKATTDPHSLKFPVAVFENVARVSLGWRPQILASVVYRLPAAGAADNHIARFVDSVRAPAPS